MTDAEATGLAMITAAIWLAYAWAAVRGWRATKPPAITLFGSEREPWER
jgi:hypothetical protein